MISGSGTIGASVGVGGVTIDDNSRGKRLFRIVSGSNPYTAVEVVLDESDGARVPTGVYDVTAAEKSLWEVNGITGVAADTVVEATPNPAGLGFYFTSPAGVSCGVLPKVHKVVVGVDFTTPKVKYRVRTVDENGCESLGPPVCENGATCSATEDVVYYCIDGVCWAYYDGLTPGTFDAGPFATPELCDSGCPVAEGELVTCCPGETTASVWFDLSGGLGSVEGVWDGTYWSYSGDPGCGATIYLRYTTGCEVQYSCDGVSWVTATAGTGSVTCGPFDDPRDWQTNWKNVLAGCSPTNPCFNTAVVNGVHL